VDAGGMGRPLMPQVRGHEWGTRSCFADRELSGLNGFRYRFDGGFGEEKVYVVGHDDAGVELEVVFEAGLFEGALEEVSGGGGVQIGDVVETTEVDRVIVAEGLVAFEA
jgi:hypothetical protein